MGGNILFAFFLPFFWSREQQASPGLCGSHCGSRNRKILEDSQEGVLVCCSGLPTLATVVKVPSWCVWTEKE
jgi:hypothetical protein